MLGVDVESTPLVILAVVAGVALSALAATRLGRRSAILAMIGNYIAKVVFLDGLLGDQVKARILQPIDGNDIIVAGGVGLIFGVILAALTAWTTLRLYVRL